MIGYEPNYKTWPMWYLKQGINQIPINFEELSWDGDYYPTEEIMTQNERIIDFITEPYKEKIESIRQDLAYRLSYYL